MRTKVFALDTDPQPALQNVGAQKIRSRSDGQCLLASFPTTH